MLTRNNIEKFYFYSIEMDGGVKNVHILRSYYDSDTFHREEYTWAMEPICDFIGASKEYERAVYHVVDIIMDVKQYMYDLTEDEYDDCIAEENADIDDGLTRRLDFKDITEDTPCGLYVGA